MDMIAQKFFTQTKIDGKEYQITKLGGLKAFTMATKLTKLLAPALGSLTDALRSEDGYSSQQTFTEIALTLVEQFDGVDLEALLSELLQGATCNGMPINDLDDHFKGEVEVLITLFAFALKENFHKVFTKNPLVIRLMENLKGLMEDGSKESVDQ